MKERIVGAPADQWGFVKNRSIAIANHHPDAALLRALRRQLPLNHHLMARARCQLTLA